MSWIIDHWRDLIIALVLAVVFAWIADYIRIGSMTRDMVRRLKSKLSERSVVKLQKRIADLERLRTLANSDRWIYLGAFQNVFATLLALGAGCTFATIVTLFSAVGHHEMRRSDIGFICLFFVVAMIIATIGLFQIAGDPAEAIQKEVSNITKNIDDLQGKLLKLKAKQINQRGKTPDDSISAN